MSEPAVKSYRVLDGNAASAAALPSLMISADSHATEPPELWQKLPAHIRERLPRFKSTNPRPEGGTIPRTRVADMDKDKLAAEVLFPDRGLALFGAPQDVQEHAFHAYNDWVAEYCAYAPNRLFGVTALCVYDIDAAIAELQRGHAMGLKGGLIWEVPHASLPYTSAHYEKLWSAAEELGQPLMMHILTGYSSNPENVPPGIEAVRMTANGRTNDKITTLFDIMWSGVFERHPKLKIGLIESEIGWAPFILQQWDYYFHRLTSPGPRQHTFPISRKPSEIFRDHVYATFIDDKVGCDLLDNWGQTNCMWSSDYPHPNMTWPRSREFAAKQIGELPYATQELVLAKNAARFFGLPF